MPTVKVYRVRWEERTKLKCKSCCSEESHPWTPEESDIFDSVKQATKFESDLIIRHEESSTEIRNIETEAAELTEWERTYDF